MKTTLFNRLTAGLLAAVLCLSVLAGCAAKPQKELTRYSTIFYDVFDTVTQVIAYCESEEEFTKQMEALHADLISYNQLYDIYNDYDGVVNVKTINDNAGKAPVQVDDRILSMLELAQKMYDTTNGKLNVAMGSATLPPGNAKESVRVPLVPGKNAGAFFLAQASALMGVACAAALCAASPVFVV